MSGYKGSCAGGKGGKTPATTPSASRPPQRLSFGGDSSKQQPGSGATAKEDQPADGLAADEAEGDVPPLDGAAADGTAGSGAPGRGGRRSARSGAANRSVAADVDSGAAAVEESQLQLTSAEKKAKSAVEALKVATAAMEAPGISPGTIRNTYAAQFQEQDLDNPMTLSFNDLRRDSDGKLLSQHPTEDVRRKRKNGADDEVEQSKKAKRAEKAAAAKVASENKELKPTLAKFGYSL